MGIISVLSVLGAAIILIVPIIFTVMNILKLKKGTKSFRFEVFAFTIGIILVIFSYALLEPIHYKEALSAENGPMLHEAFNVNHLLTLFIIWCVGLFSYFVLKYGKKKFPPILEAVMLAGVYAGIIISVMAVIQLFGGYRADFVYIIIVSYINLFLVNYLMLAINLLLVITKRKAEEQREISYNNPFLKLCNHWLLKGGNLYLGALIMLIPLMAALILILLIFGQSPDSVIKVFTQTSDWMLSTQVSPPALENGGHYLCTVSLRGHKKLVKPIRYGIRNGNKIVVNRQLCIANAFEQLIMEKTPRFHHAIRNFYDTYGYPVSKLIKKPWVADVIYLLMKPLEWLFLLVLYTFDQKPEDRIARQYLPGAPV